MGRGPGPVTAPLIQSLLLIVCVRFEVQKGSAPPLQRVQVMMRDTSPVMGEVRGPVEGRVTQLLFKSVSVGLWSLKSPPQSQSLPYLISPTRR